MSIEVKNLTHTYSAGSALQQTAIRDVNLTIEEGEFVAKNGTKGVKPYTTYHLTEAGREFPEA